MMKQTFALMLFLASFALAAQLPDSDIWIFEIKKTEVGIILKKGYNVTSRKGYDNQPWFNHDNKFFYYTSIHEDGQAHIYRYDFSSKKIIQITSTATSEYSPMLTPDRKEISVLMVEKDSTQRVWGFSLDGKTNHVITEFEDSIGYYAWLNKDTMLYYKLTAPHSLRAYSIKEKKEVWLCDEPTRAFKPTGKKNEFFYVVKLKEKNEVRLYNITLKKSTLYAEAKPENEDFIWDKTLGLIKSDGSKLMRFMPEHNTWAELGDFTSSGITKITRFAISSNGRFVALVSNK